MSLYLKYRPNDFKSLVGQEFIKKTLTKAIISNKMVGAYLLCGPRGTGKTSTARILAKAINCLNPDNGNPCNKCDICNSFNEGQLIDIIEIDAASNTGVDNIRDLIERAQFSPTKCKYKVYIIDEVHMLSTGAFNALLKILEEPPEHLKFILATTEVHKIPETILSRTQRYDFKRITNSDIKTRLEYIAKEENVIIDNESYDFIISNSGGGLRNAISLFEQYIIDGKIDYDNIISNLGLVTNDKKEDFYNKLIQSDETIISDFESIIDSGVNIRLFIKDLIYFIKDKILSDLNTVTLNSNIHIIDLLQDAYIKSKNTFDEQLYFTITLVKIIKKYSPIVEQNNNAQSISKNNVTNIKKSETIINKEEIVESNISSDDIDDIFGDTVLEKKEVKESNNTSGETIFNTDNFISKVKEKGGKGGLTMSLRGSTITFNGTELRINSTNAITHKNISDSANKDIMFNALVDIGLDNIEIIVN